MTTLVNTISLCIHPQIPLRGKREALNKWEGKVKILNTGKISVGGSSKPESLWSVCV